MSIALICPLCGGVITPTGYTAERNQLGLCSECGTPVTVTVVAHYSRGNVNQAAPYYPLVMLVDELANTRIPPQMTESSTGPPHAFQSTIDDMETVA